MTRKFVKTSLFSEFGGITTNPLPQPVEMSGSDRGNVNCLNCGYEFEVQWDWSLTSEAKKHFSLDQSYGCPDCGAEYLYRIEQSNNYGKIIGAAESVSRYNKLVAEWRKQEYNEMHGGYE